MVDIAAVNTADLGSFEITNGLIKQPSCMLIDYTIETMPLVPGGFKLQTYRTFV